ncbi:MAG: binding-protein-dependent transport system inner rane component [Desertimonas sp.]|jgi:peptide/nickel transport system permease protein/oligopeptide transport system permease protein|nr:binding-protein-dependent transport system inner rane component [Desertimonas sp.]
MTDLTAGTEIGPGHHPAPVELAEGIPGAPLGDLSHLGEPTGERHATLWADARRQLIRSKVFVMSCFWVVIVTSMALVPRLWTSIDPRACNVSNARLPISSEHWMGTSVVGCDYYAHGIYGARPSLTIALLGTLGVTVIGGAMGMIAGFYGGKVDSIISRTIDFILALPFLLGAFVFLGVLKIYSVWTVSAVIVILSWTIIARIMRGSVLSGKNLDYVQAAKALGASNRRVMVKHILPNAIAPVLVYTTILFGGYVAVEATLTFLGVGLRPPAISWGVMITQHENRFLQHPNLLLWPAGLLFLTVLSFILIGDALRDALDPKLR